MKAYQIKFTKPFMNILLASEGFDAFLVEEVSITTFNTFHIDGHIVKEFYNKDELTENDSVVPSLSAWSTIRPICFQLIKGKNPLYHSALFCMLHSLGWKRLRQTKNVKSIPT